MTTRILTTTKLWCYNKQCHLNRMTCQGFLLLHLDIMFPLLGRNLIRCQFKSAICNTHKSSSHTHSLFCVFLLKISITKFLIKNRKKGQNGFTVFDIALAFSSPVFWASFSFNSQLYCSLKTFNILFRDKTTVLCTSIAAVYLQMYATAAGSNNREILILDFRWETWRKHFFFRRKCVRLISLYIPQIVSFFMVILFLNFESILENNDAK